MTRVYVAPYTRANHSQAELRSPGTIKGMASETPPERRQPLYEWINLPERVMAQIPGGYKGPLYKFYGDYDKYAESLCESPEEIYARWIQGSQRVSL